MYEIIINETPFFLVKTTYIAEHKIRQTDNILVMRFLKKNKQIFSIIDFLENTNRLSAVYLYSDDVEAIFHQIKNLFIYVEAAGGVVKNTATNKVLFMFRRGSWDLPKGKIDAGELREQAALREVNEETGLSTLQIEKFIIPTYHTYRINKKRYLKKTFWFAMATPEVLTIPQTEEDIEKIIWDDAVQFLARENLVYRNIKMVLQEYLFGN